MYLPSFSDENIIKVLSEIPVEWKVFPNTAKLQKMLRFFPIDEIQYLKYFENCDGILCNAGFETPTPEHFLWIKLFVIPIHQSI